ncbi:MAG: hypothetical protein ACI9BW_000248 [Gammaproteobacteria bacterium]|jgi:hypothetical protein
MKTTIRLALSAALLSFSAIAVGYSAYGLGQLECKTYLDRRGEDQEKHDVTNTSYIHAYLSGYLTAGNTMHGLVGDTAKDVSIDIHKMVQWLDAWCLKNTTTSVSVALESFWVEAAKAKEQLRRTNPTQNRR